MSISIDRARQFVYANGLLWEQALFSYLFDGGSIERLHSCLLNYKNADGGWAHGLEHDIKCPDSHPLALEFLLTINRDTGVPITALLDGTVEWVERNREADGSLRNPDTLLKYPHAPWWSGGGQTKPDSITGNLIRLGLCSDELQATTAGWASENLNLAQIEANEWLFMAYHAFDYYVNAPEKPELAPLREAAIANIIACASKAEPKQYFSYFHFARTPDSPVAKATPAELLNKFLDHLASSQREDGGWDDEHGLKHWQSYFTVMVLNVLRNYGRL
ncbi:hypothetical protein A8990_12443 [Paenibacillus taihuensis]|uniref:Prenyltransferase/squalene oxidase-like repeat protein n=1 Tax=Paenibacillus taihuensis TaxID=1156355 RepID=A0A3D9RJ06_9BACL|nr:hypothetical protein [Paenibacillus taihuensis]REE78767.1 hypothetical protein A8990_12443 [Paenibacillus taihuensis]